MIICITFTFWYFCICLLGYEAKERFEQSETSDRMQAGAHNASKSLNRFQQTFTKEIKDGFKELRDDIEKQKGKDR